MKKIEQGCIMAGIDNAVVKETESNIGNSIKPWHGYALAAIRSTHSAGDIKLTVSSPDLAEATLHIKAFSEKK